MHLVTSSLLEFGGIRFFSFHLWLSRDLDLLRAVACRVTKMETCRVTERCLVTELSLIRQLKVAMSNQILPVYVSFLRHYRQYA